MGGSGSSSGKGGSSGGAGKLLCLRLKSTRMSTYSPGAKDLLAVVTGHLTLVAKHISSMELIQKLLKKQRRKHKKKDKGE